VLTPSALFVPVLVPPSLDIAAFMASCNITMPPAETDDETETDPTTVPTMQATSSAHSVMAMAAMGVTLLAAAIPVVLAL
jgi:hypothetical protein